MRFFFILLSFALLSKTSVAQTKYQSDFQYYWQTINDNFACFHPQHAGWNKVKAIYQPMADTVSSNRAFIQHQLSGEL